MCAQAGLLKSKCQKFVKSHISVLVEELTTSDSVRTICVNVKACKSVAVTCPRPRPRRSSYSNRTWIAQTNDWKHHTSKRSDSLVSFFSRRSCKFFCSSVHVNFFFFFLFSPEKRRLLPNACTTWKRKWNWRNISERLNWMSAWRLSESRLFVAPDPFCAFALSASFIFVSQQPINVWWFKMYLVSVRFTLPEVSELQIQK